MTRIVSLALLLLSLNSLAQDTLPKFSAYTRGNDKVIIGWTNTYPKVSQISIQRSFDSLKLFKTILTVPDPMVPQNGYLDAKGTNPKMFYRLFIVLDSGKYVFTQSQRPHYDTTSHSAYVPKTEVMPENNVRQRVVIAENMAPKEAELLKEKIQEATRKEEPKTVSPVEKPKPAPEPERFFIIKRRDSVIRLLPAKQLGRFRDSIVLRTRDTMTFRNSDTILLKPFIPKAVFKPSRFVYSDNTGNVVIQLPDVKTKNFAVKFFEDDGTFLFEVKQIKEPYLVVDKTNFLHAGWFKFELLEDGKEKELHKFFIPKD
ncbi:hypothetical protein [Paraflavitalea sp. CAU 1676]|uniref:hypothetical protein n=1 Tax=Paraflavitalea sp. CAU 1676 TaxID=3032598 RepID=UPI0023D9C128|nr:hypothetical protein [Paraflavitalea sp. CAU 1676]MDF2191766.1 hypothetical protein [Paraflavitalea sp. CAU 1676]